MKKAFLVLEDGPAFQGVLRGGEARAGEVVFNTSHSGYEEIATDPSYFSQMVVCTAPQQGNYGASQEAWESRRIWINGFVCLEMQNSERDGAWLKQLAANKVPVLTDLDTRSVALYLRDRGTVWGAIIDAEDESEARRKAQTLIREARDLPADWTKLVCRKSVEEIKGDNPRGPRVAVYDFGTKENILRELRSRASEIAVFPSGTDAKIVKDWNPDGIVLTNGPGDPAEVKDGIREVRNLLGWRPIFGICMGHQVLALALGGKTYKLKFGHRGSNHPIQDRILGRVYVASQNHGYNVDPQSLPSGVQVTHTNLNDGTLAGLASDEHRCWSVQFHPESHPGPHEAAELFDFFIEKMR